MDIGGGWLPGEAEPAGEQAEVIAAPNLLPPPCGVWDPRRKHLSLLLQALPPV